MTTLHAHRSAIIRGGFSRPIRLAIESGILAEGDSVFDYGCGQGEDLAGLRKEGYDAAGWDPHFRPNQPLRESDVVNIGYVVNVIEQPSERDHALRSAWRLSRKALLVSARLNDERRNIRNGRAYNDGCITGNGTFQRFYSQQELRTWIDTTLGLESIAAAPGVFIVFRTEGDENAFLLRTRRRRTVDVAVTRADRLFDEHRSILEPLIDFFTERGRLPRGGEASSIMEPIRHHLWSPNRAWKIITGAADPDVDWDGLAAARREDLLVDLALLRLNRRPNFGKLPDSVQHDVKSFFGSYKNAVAAADDLLFGAGDLERLTQLADVSDRAKRLPTALYVHREGLSHLPGPLRVYEGCARWLVGDVDGGTIIKLATDKAKVSYLSYPEFDRDPHPALERTTFVRLSSLDVDVRDYSQSENPPILHRKESFVPPEYPGRDKFARLTAQEERFGLFDSDTSAIGTRLGWQARLVEMGVELRGHRVVRGGAHRRTH